MKKWWKRQKTDERIEKESNKIAPIVFFMTICLAVISFLVKIANGLPAKLFLWEIVLVVAGMGYVLIEEARKEILFLKEKDEALREIQNKIFSKAFSFVMSLSTWGGLLLLLLMPQDVLWIASYLIIAFVPCLFYTIYVLRHGLILWGGKAQKETGKKKLIKPVILGSIFFGIINGLGMTFRDGAFHADGVLWMLGMGASWGIMFYFLFSLVLSIGEKRANKIEKELEKQIEE